MEHKDTKAFYQNPQDDGKPINHIIPGEPGFRERVNFGEFIGYFIDPNLPNVKLPTTKGIIHYGKRGAHIVPARP